MINNKPLVSIIVLTYNSAKTVIETLESVKSQDYENLELIITDDGSQDSTVDLCNKWLNDNSKIFKFSVIIDPKKNTGTASNINRGVHASHGDWIKAIAGDDLFCAGAISAFIEYISHNTGDIFCSDCEVFTPDGKVPQAVVDSYERFFKLVDEPQKKQLWRIAYDYIIPGPGLFFSRHLYNLVGGFDERFGLAEEIPFVFNVLKKGFRVIPIPQKLIRYRYSLNSVSHSNHSLSNKKWFDDSKGVYYKYQYPELIRTGRFFKAYEKSICFYIDELKYKNTFGAKCRIKFLNFLNPRYYRNAIIKINKIYKKYGL